MKADALTRAQARAAVAMSDDVAALRAALAAAEATNVAYAETVTDLTRERDVLKAALAIARPPLPVRMADCGVYCATAKKLIEQADAAEAERDALKAALQEARVALADWAGYASEHFQRKYDLAGDLAAIDAALSEGQG